MPNSRSATKKSAAAVHDDNNQVSNDDFNTMMDKKLNKQENSNLQERTRIDRQDLEKYCEENEQYSRRLCLRIKNLKKQ